MDAKIAALAAKVGERLEGENPGTALLALQVVVISVLAMVTSERDYSDGAKAWFADVVQNESLARIMRARASSLRRQNMN